MKWVHKYTTVLVLSALMGSSSSFGQNAAPNLESRSARDPERTVRIAVVQAGEGHYANGNPGPQANFDVLAKQAREAAAAEPRPELICFPEYSLSGWPYPEDKEINSLAEKIPGDGPWYRQYRDLARKIGVALLGSAVELDEGRRYNCAFIIDSKGEFRGKYRKLHATIGEQGWWGWSRGKRFELLELDGVRYGISICADMWFPETVRSLEMLGADIVLHQSIGDDMGKIIPTRAFDSELPIFMAIFQGGSYAVDERGEMLSKLPSDKPAWRTFEVQPFKLSRHTKFVGMKHDSRKVIYNMRSPAAYSILVDPSTRVPWTEMFTDGEGRTLTREEISKRFDGHYDDDDPGQSVSATAPASGSNK